MDNKGIYLDYAATSPTDPAVVEAMRPFFFDNFANASSIHSFGQRSKEALESARSKVAELIGSQPGEIIFNSGGTESNNHAIIGVAYANKNRGNHIITSAIEHHAVLEPLKFLKAQGFSISIVNVDKYGLVDPQEVKKLINNKTILVSIMQANNEVGTIEPIEEIAKIIKDKEVYFHTDAVQAVGHIPVDVGSLGVDLLSLSSHKFCGPKGVGALYVKKGTRITRFMHGGDQENKLRASTYNIPGIVGLSKALEISCRDLEKEMASEVILRDKLIKNILEAIPESYLNGHPVKRLPNNANFSFNYIEGESILLNLDFEGIAASSGSACASDSLEPSHVLLACGLEHVLAHGSIRFSLGRWTKESDIDRVIEVLPGIVRKLRMMSPLYRKKE